ncbi:PREDICTED: uncharacterized protein LOC108579245 isoform X2 [Habropoda laboriosa]|uniref:uncharacterized protein LOC108579245 isoform X2 n=1 Tax=Habropoda laboriosa TaxID=597456 RepID=UPI00083D6B37|nr:PREDICTED: uncharacterized protein LOC108579245 isoform X2 [Habropoda laboriosa]XP_017798220.1 PREDICTED: uncharacterized protein LOC108579245 isoform X2 [Habropoda laboriosa]
MQRELKSLQRREPYDKSPRPLEKNLPQMMYDTIKTKPVATASSTQHYSTVSPKILKLRQEMQADMTKPVFLIRGTRDKVCFGVTVALAAVCTVLNFTNFVELKKKFK